MWHLGERVGGTCSSLGDRVVAWIRDVAVWMEKGGAFETVKRLNV